MQALDLCQRELAALAAVRATWSLREWREAHMDGNAHNVAPFIATGYRNLHVLWYTNRGEPNRLRYTRNRNGHG